jgi:hypothetical protein
MNYKQLESYPFLWQTLIETMIKIKNSENLSLIYRILRKCERIGII